MTIKPKQNIPLNGRPRPPSVRRFRRLIRAVWQQVLRIAVSIGFRAVVTAITVVALLGVGAATLMTSYRVVSDNKLRDVWAILFLELEKRAGEIGQAFAQKAGHGSPTTIEVALDGQLKVVDGPPIPVTRLADFGVDHLEDFTPWNLLYHKQAVYVAKVLSPTAKRRIELRSFTEVITLPDSSQPGKSTKVYVASRQGKLVFANAAEVREGDFLSRPLVQKFISLPIWQGQVDLFDAENRPFYGFFQEIPGTNLIIFAETPKSTVTDAVAAVGRRLAVTLMATIAAAIALLQAPLFLLLRPLRSLVNLAKRVAAGDFDARPDSLGFGEVRVLARAFGDMTGALKLRDETISKLMRDQAKKTRLEVELALARSIQDSLLPQNSLDSASGLELAACYQPAGEVAGDWYGYFYVPERQVAVVAIVDISGHGAGASMFTAIAASIFEDLRVRFAEGAAPDTFFHNLHHNLRCYGHGKWSATAQMVLFWKGRGELEVINAGHPSVLVSAASSTDATKVHRHPFGPLPRLSSSLLGLTDQLNLARRQVPLPKQGLAVLYTDGLSERRDPRGQPFGVRRISTTLGRAPQRRPADLIAGLMHAADDHARRQTPDDDICLIAMRAVD